MQKGPGLILQGGLGPCCSSTPSHLHPRRICHPPSPDGRGIRQQGQASCKVCWDRAYTPPSKLPSSRQIIRRCGYNCTLKHGNGEGTPACRLGAKQFVLASYASKLCCNALLVTSPGAARKTWKVCQLPRLYGVVLPEFGSYPNHIFPFGAGDPRVRLKASGSCVRFIWSLILLVVESFPATDSMAWGCTEIWRCLKSALITARLTGPLAPQERQWLHYLKFWFKCI
jgi:hypothetical protein